MSRDNAVINRSAQVIRRLYLALRRPHPDYAVLSVSPYFFYRMDIDSLESIKRTIEISHTVTG